MKQLRKATIECLERSRCLLETLDCHPRGKEVYLKSGIGRHTRHVIDHYLAYIKGLGNGIIDYNKRDRESALETDLDLGCGKIKYLIHWFSNTEDLEQDRKIEIESEISCQDTVNVRIPSNLAREMHYVTYHGLHHMAYCLILAEIEGIPLDPELGLAPGTATYLRAANN